MVARLLPNGIRLICLWVVVLGCIAISASGLGAQTVRGQTGQKGGQPAGGKVGGNAGGNGGTPNGGVEGVTLNGSGLSVRGAPQVTTGDTPGENSGRGTNNAYVLTRRDKRVISQLLENRRARDLSVLPMVAKIRRVTSR
jgi:hypothetical protein